VRQQVSPRLPGSGRYDASISLRVPGFLLIFLGGINRSFHSAGEVLARRVPQEGARSASLRSHPGGGSGLLRVTILSGGPGRPFNHPGGRPRG